MRAPGIAETSAFIAVVEQRSFTKAARLLGLSPARVSEMVRKTEDQLGMRLIERTTRSGARRGQPVLFRGQRQAADTPGPSRP
jgi:molybdenum-dependent DNA-binding transcriptional regulator ModE